MSQQMMMRERFQKAKWEQFCAHFNNHLKVLNFDENQWTIEVKQRKTGHSEGSFDAYYLFCSEEKQKGKTKRFRSLKEVERKLREDAQETKEKKTSTEKQSSSPPPPPSPFVVVEGEQQEKKQQQRKSCGRRTGGLTSSFREDEMKFKSAMDDEEEEEEDEDDEPVCPSAFLKTTTKTMGRGRGGGLGRAKVLANTTPSGAQQQRQRQQQHHQRAFHPSRPPFHHSNNNNNNNISNSNNNTSAKTHSRLHNSFVANSSRLEVAAVRDDERRITKRNQNGKRKETEETRGQDWRISNPSDAEELLEKKREEDPEVAREHRILKERFSGKSVANTANSINNNNDNNNTQKENNQRQRRRERNALPSKYEHLALVFNGLKMYRELLRMRNSAETVENICACAKNLVKRDVRFEHLRKIETVRPGTFAFTKRKRDATKNAVDEKHRPEEGRTFVDPKSVRLEILEERVMKRESVDGEDEDCNGDEEENGKKVVKKREKSSLLMSEKERERAREADFNSRLMRLCDEAHVAFCRNHGIVISPSSNVSEQMLWHETFDVEREAPDIAECAVRDAPPLMPPAGGTAAAAATTTTTTTTTTTSAPSLMLLHTPKPPSSTPSTGTYPLTPLIMTTATKKKVVTERDIDEEVRRMQKENGGVCEDDDNLENDDYLAGNINNASANDGKDSTTTIGVSRQAIRRVLERKIEKDLLHSPSAVALRAENKIKQNLPRIFDLVHSLFATSRKRAFAFDILLHKTHEQLNAKDIGGMFYSRDEIEDCLRTLAKTCSEWCKIERAQDGEELFRIVVGSSSSRSLSDPSSSPSLTPFFSGGAAAVASRGRGRHLMVRKTTTFLPPPSSSSSPRSRQKPTSTTKEREENDDAGFTPTTIQTINPKKRSSFPSNSIFVGNNNKESSSSSPRDGVAKRVKQKLLLEAAPAFVLGGGK